MLIDIHFFWFAICTIVGGIGLALCNLALEKFSVSLYQRRYRQAPKEADDARSLAADVYEDIESDLKVPPVTPHIEILSQVQKLAALTGPQVLLPESSRTAVGEVTQESCYNLPEAHSGRVDEPIDVAVDLVLHEECIGGASSSAEARRSPKSCMSLQDGDGVVGAADSDAINNSCDVAAETALGCVRQCSTALMSEVARESSCVAAEVPLSSVRECTVIGKAAVADEAALSHVRECSFALVSEMVGASIDVPSEAALGAVRECAVLH